MTTERIEIVVTKTGDKEARKGIEGIGEAANTAQKPVDGLNSSLGYLKATLAGIGVGAVVSEYIKLADTFTGIVNRLKLVTNSTAELAKTEQALFEMSNRTFASFEGTASLYTRLAMSASSLGVEQKSLLPTLETINKLIAVSGATANEAQSGLLQFSQGLQSNRFQGDELRSVLENLPALGQAIAKGLGVTTGELREMGKQGELTAKMVLEAIDKGAPEAAKKFAQITPTVSQAFQVLKNNLLQAVGLFDQAKGVSGLLAQAILFVGNNLMTFVKIVGLATAALASFYAGLYVQAAWNAVTAAMAAFTARVAAANIVLGYAGIQLTVWQKIMMAATTPINAVTSALQRLWAVVLANPLTAIIALLGAAVAALYLWGDQVKLTSDGSINAWGAVVGTLKTLWDLMVQFGSWIATTFKPYWDVIAAAAKWAFGIIWEGITLVIRGLGLLFPSMATLSAKLDGLGATWKKNMQEASKASGDTSLKVDVLKKSTDDFAASAGAAGAAAQFSADGMTQMGRVAAESIPPFENLIRKQRELNDMVKKGKEAFDKNREALEKYRQAEQDLTVTTRDAMGNIIKYTNEAENQTGRFFSGAQQGAAATAEAFDNLTESISRSTAAAAESQTTSSGTVAPPNPRDQVSRAFQSQGGSSAQFDGLFKALTDAEFFVGTPMGGDAVQRLYNMLAQQPEKAAKSFVDNYPYVNTWMKAQGLPTFRRGGEFQVGGSGGGDSQLVQFMANPNENVTIETAAQRRKRLAGQENTGKGSRTTIVNMQVSTPDANSFNRSKNQTYLALKSRLAGV